MTANFWHCTLRIQEHSTPFEVTDPQNNYRRKTPSIGLYSALSFQISVFNFKPQKFLPTAFHKIHKNQQHRHTNKKDNCTLCLEPLITETKAATIDQKFNPAEMGSCQKP